MTNQNGMPRTEWMFDVEVQKKCKKGDKISLEWFKNPVTLVSKKDVIRCTHCKQDVILHQGPQKKRDWHAQHKNIEDAIECSGSPEGKKGSNMPPRPKNQD